MYEYLIENLISYRQVDDNLRRTADRGLISELYRKQMNKLALKYFGVDSSGNYTENKDKIVAYRCPYSGEIINDLSKSHLEHILPVSSNGGTVLFNCVPVSQEANYSKLDEPNLLTWWKEQKKYFNYDRLERLIQYMLEAYTLSFKKPNEEDLYNYEFGYDYDSDEKRYDDLSKDEIDEYNILKEKKRKNKNVTVTYYQLLTDMINELSKNRDVSKYNEKLNNLKEQNVFGNINEIEKVIHAVQTVFKEVLGEDSKKYLSYSLKIDMNKLLKSLITNNYEQEIRERMTYINELVKSTDKTIDEFFISLSDIEEYNILYYSNPSKEIINEFLENIKLGYDSKINIFIDMIKHAKTKEDLEEIFKQKSKKTFTTYKKNENGEDIIDKTYGEIGYFWNANKKKINPIIEELIKEDKNLRDLLDEYYINTTSGRTSYEGKQRSINIFIDMIKHAKTKEDLEELFKVKSKKPFTTYKKNENGEDIIDKTYGEIGYIWSNNEDKINPIIEELIKEDKNLRDLFDEYYINTTSGQNTIEGTQRRINIFIDMIKHAKTKEDLEEIFKAKSKKPFTTYKKNENGEDIIDKTYGEIGYFWNSNKDKINKKIGGIIKEDKNLRDLLDEYYINTTSGQNTIEGTQRRINIFIDMIKHAKTKEDLEELFKNGKTKPFTTYKKNENGENIIDKTYGEIGPFWSNNKDKINPIIEELIKENIDLRDLLDDYYINTKSGRDSLEGQQRTINIFIDMIKHAKTKEDLEELFNQRTTKPFTTYKKNENDEEIIDKKYGEISGFWSNNKDKINPIIEELIKEDKNLRDLLDEYYINTTSGQNTIEGTQRRINIFIDMIKHAKTKEDLEEIFKQKSKKPFTTYKKNENGEDIIDKTYGEIGCIWSNNKDKINPIIEELIKEDKNLRDLFDEYYINTTSGRTTYEGKQRSINIFIDMIKHAKTKEDLEELFKNGTTKPFTTYKKNENGEDIIDKTYGEIGCIWSSNKDKINKKIGGIIKEDKNLRDLFDEYYINTTSGRTTYEGTQRRINIFINMIKHAKTKEDLEEIFKARSKKTFTTYKKNENGEDIIDKTYGEIGPFWNNNKNKNIIPALFLLEEYNKHEYDIVRQRVLEYLNSLRIKKKMPIFNNIDEYIDTLDKNKKETTELIKIRDSWNEKIKECIIENNEMNEYLNTSNRRAM